MEKCVEGVIKNSLLVKDGYQVYWPSNDKYSTIDTSTDTMKKLNWLYCPDNGLVGFIFDNQLFITHYRDGIFDELESLGFRFDKQFYVPLAHEERPVGEFAEEWERFIKNCRK